MQTGLHAVGWGLTRMGIAALVIGFGAIFAYVMWIVVIVVGQGISAFGQ